MFIINKKFYEAIPVNPYLKSYHYTVDKEFIIKKVPASAIVFYSAALLLACVGVNNILHEKYIMGVLAIVIGISFLFLKRFEPKKAQVVIKINDLRLWTRNRGNKPWSTILCIKFRYEGKNSFMDIYRSNDVIADEELNLHGINMPVWRLKRILKKYARVENH